MSGQDARPAARDGLVRPLAVAGGIFVVCFGGLAAWAWQAPVASAVVATGELRVEGQSKTVQHLDGGIVREILVLEGERVAAGQPLIRLDATEAEAERAALAAERDALAARSARLRAELEGGAAPDFASLQAHGDSMEAAIASQRALFSARMEERAAEVDMLNGTLARLGSRVRAIGAEIEGVTAQIALVQEDAAVSRALVDRGNATRSALRDVERDLAGLIAARASLEAQLAEAEAAEAEAALQRAEAETRRISAVSQEMSEVAARLAEIAPSLEALETRIARADLRAPVAGVVVGLDVATVGGVIAPGEPVLDIVPESATLVAEARVAPADRERLHPEMAAEIRITGVQRQRDASIEGLVTRISADRLPGEDAEGNGYYAMTVALGAAPDDLSLAPGMPVTAIVATSSRSPLEYVVSPLRDAIARSMREE